MMTTFFNLLNLPYFFIPFVGLIGLLVGSFLNVVIYRLPLMLEQSWQRECHQYLNIDTAQDTPVQTFNLALPLSHCPQCKAGIKPQHNIPVLSYLFLKGRCAACQHIISPRYPLLELLSAVSAMIVADHFGLTLTTVFALLLTWSLITLSFIDIDHQLLPDTITLPVLWLGLFLSLFNIFVDPYASITGAIGGYLSLWLVFHVFKLITGKEGMGYGDFKLLALLGAWLGWQYLPLIILLSSLVGSVFGFTLIAFYKHDHKVPIPFGPYLAMAGWLALLYGKGLNQFYFSAFGL
jgi:leader peptidase (prepilin peptidase)/N-methyltransferase